MKTMTRFFLSIVFSALFFLLNTHPQAFAFNEKSLPLNGKVSYMPLSIDVCLIDDFKTTEILVKGGGFKISAVIGGKKKTFDATGESLKLSVKKIYDSKPAVIEYYAILKTFPYTYLASDSNKKKDCVETIESLEKTFGKLRFFTYGGVLKSRKSDKTIDIRTVFCAAGPFKNEELCRKFCDSTREKHSMQSFAHPYRLKNASCNFDVSLEYDTVSKGVPKSFSKKLSGVSRIELDVKDRMTIKSMEFGRGDKWHCYKDALYAGKLTIKSDNKGFLELVNTIGFDELLKVVVPSEIEPKSPYQAICAQAIAARSEILSKFETRHTETDYDFCAATHCQAYGGIGNRTADADNAVAETSSKILFSDGHIVDTVYHADCGGLTEDSNKVWSSPYDPALISISDSTLETALDFSTNEAALRKFILNPPPCYCSVAGACNNGDKFRWKREYSQKQVEEMIARQFIIGELLEIKTVERGKSGRLMAIELVGTRAKQKVYKELNIRKLFGMLRSGLFIIETENRSGVKYYKFTGAGWGHGVGMCQDGAKGMGLSGKNYEEILNHYFSNSEILNFK